MEGLVMATSLIGATIITIFFGPVSDAVGRYRLLMLCTTLAHEEEDKQAKGPYHEEEGGEVEQ
ncbi:hypothetical protein U9M48_025067 [Paspalum notatum var. saurae]|uniref:Uncharacterized protein n=1 Tax=Paspalum notatum var. saurae TaxID=547442 RepID=A0AAQ3WWQ9_PASNO